MSADVAEIEFYKQVAIEAQRITLQVQRNALDLAVAFRIALEKPEVDIREDLDILIRDLSSTIAVLEEHVL